jgi:branched-chain amino acid aminotransferase
MTQNTSAISVKISKTPQSRIQFCDFDNIQFGTIMADHMFRVDYEDGVWQNPCIVPYGPIQVQPSVSALHYGQSIFEGMKAFKNQQGEPQLFRPLDNLARLNRSAVRMAMPTLPENIFMEGLKQLINVDKDWIPVKEGSALYIRPFMFATDDFVGVRPSKKFTFIIFTCPVNSYYPKPINVLIEQKYVRAFEGGVGATKVAGNYGLSMQPTFEAQQKGFDQIIWTDGREHNYVEESGTTNLFFVIGDTVVTPDLDGCILEGITRDSCIKILKHKGIKIEERKITINEIIDAHKNGTLKDAFGTGTAALIAKIASIHYNGETYTLPKVEEREISNLLYAEMESIRTSRSEDVFGWVVKA